MKTCEVQRHGHVRIDKGPVQTVAIELEAHNSLEYHYMCGEGGVGRGNALRGERVRRPAGKQLASE